MKTLTLFLVCLLPTIEPAGDGAVCTIYFNRAGGFGGDKDDCIRNSEFDVTVYNSDRSVIFTRLYSNKGYMRFWVNSGKYNDKYVVEIIRISHDATEEKKVISNFCYGNAVLKDTPFIIFVLGD